MSVTVRVRSVEKDLKNFEFQLDAGEANSEGFEFRLSAGFNSKLDLRLEKIIAYLQNYTNTAVYLLDPSTGAVVSAIADGGLYEYRVSSKTHAWTQTSKKRKRRKRNLKSDLNFPPSGVSRTKYLEIRAQFKVG